MAEHCKYPNTNNESSCRIDIESHLALLWQKLTLENLLAKQRITEKQLKEKIEVIEGINKICIDREVEMIKLKKEIAKLKEDLKQARRDIK